RMMEEEGPGLSRSDRPGIRCRNQPGLLPDLRGEDGGLVGVPGGVGVEVLRRAEDPSGDVDAVDVGVPGALLLAVEGVVLVDVVGHAALSNRILERVVDELDAVVDPSLLELCEVFAPSVVTSEREEPGVSQNFDPRIRSLLSDRSEEIDPRLAKARGDAGAISVRRVEE